MENNESKKLALQVFSTSCHITDEYSNTMCELHFAHYNDKASCLKQANLIVIACNNYQALKEDNTLLKEVNEAQIFTIEKYQKENEELTTQLAKANSDKEKLVELLKEYEKELNTEKWEASNNENLPEFLRISKIQHKVQQTLQDCGITL